MKTPNYIVEFLRKNTDVLVDFANLAPSHKREYIQWIEEAKQKKTKTRRMEKMTKMLIEKQERIKDFIGQ